MNCDRKFLMLGLLAALAASFGCSRSPEADPAGDDSAANRSVDRAETPGLSVPVERTAESSAVAERRDPEAASPNDKKPPELSELRGLPWREDSDEVSEVPAVLRAPSPADRSLPARRAEAPSDAAGRAVLAREVGAYLEALRREAREEAGKVGFPVRARDADGRPLDLVAVRNGRPVYRTTFNSTAADAARVTPLYESARRESEFDLSGAGVTVGVWDEARVLDFHREFEDQRVTNHYPEPLYSHHSTHVAGTIAARGAEADAQGMAPAALVDAYNWDQALAEMVNRAPAYPGEPGSLALANHSYGLVSGWFFLREEEAFVFTGFERFGRYDEFTYLTDLVAHASPYQLSVWAAGNHRSGDPAPGDPVLLDDEPVPYDPDVHPAGDGDYKRGFDTINSFQIAKNVLTVGALDYSTAAENTSRLNEARMTAFSSWGPTDDGRVKPDLVAHGVSLFSPIAIDGWYASASGTSMAAPVATGVLALLEEQYDRHFPGHALRSSTLKALLVHTADDLGNAGPDHRYGWGLINARAAAEIVADYADSPRPGLLVEERLSAGRPVAEYPVEAGGGEPLEVTLAWTDPPAAGPVEDSDDRNPTLVNNLHLRVLAPDGETTHHPYRLNRDVPSAPATTGINDVDNVLRVEIPSPSDTGPYTVVVEHSGSLFGEEQVYSLVMTGAAESPAAVAVPAVAGLSPSAGPNDGTAVVEVSGEGFLLGTDVRLTRPGEEAREAFGVEATGERLRARFDLYGATPGVWDLEVQSPAGETAVREEAFEVEETCHFVLDPDTADIPSSGGFFSVRLDSSLEACEWTLESTEDWLLFLTPRSGTGDAEVIYSVGTHSGSAVPRSAEIRVNGQAVLTVNQEGVAPVALEDAVRRSDFIRGRDRQADWKYYRFEVPQLTAGKVSILLERLTGDADLYVRRGEKPDLENFDCRPALGGNQEELCEFANPEPGTWWIGVNNWDTGRIDYAITATLTVDELTYSDWVTNVFEPDDAGDPAISDPTADPGNFGISNLLRYALALDTREPDRENLPRVGVVEEDGERYLFLEYTLRKAMANTGVEVEVSDDLRSWRVLNGTTETVEENTTTRTLRTRQTEPISSTDARFLRLRVTME